MKDELLSEDEPVLPWQDGAVGTRTIHRVTVAVGEPFAISPHVQVLHCVPDKVGGTLDLYVLT